ncbi:3-isopropylmalate dehydratase small subunit [Microvirga guangxiensis]|uniref:3-isopropylmalate dehydratase small subunit n=1 Tax=Microvirga guangxiensis TaxID=549386 RepID=A0A1G5LD35_9HYPH|nr:3-isopropylmalate dehydratase small subunit [Microvirga guangxiensis]SCZ10059.1 3-isopropylmalate/(R)-2-methylmalate dehydratase small subunit [Microvirga guangxiensis]
MQPFTQHTGIACPLPLSGIDTDQLIPARFMKRSRAEGYGDYLLHDLRFDGNGDPREDFPLNHSDRRGASILVTRRNFGGGSSREAAAYALIDYGIRCVVAPSFGDIFASNSVNNGLLPARVSEEDGERLLAALQGGERDATVDLNAKIIRCGSLDVPFDIEPVWRTKLLNGWDDIDLTKSYTAAIQAFAASDQERRPWMKPNRA